uniref:PTTG1 interacting protein n=1 Tax=Xiphophorus couchianus TaxID=32473 RepID=A0A3B5M3J4_9TELE
GTSCDDCLKNVTCLWCTTTKSCVTYPVGTILPPHSLCELNDARWGLCWMNFQTLIITLSVLGAVLIIAIMVCMFCCCKCENFGNDMNSFVAHGEMLCLHRRAEMNKRHQEIRQKYGELF